MTRSTYAELVALVEGDVELIERLLDEGLIDPCGEAGALVDVDRVLVVRTLWRDLELDWPAIEVIVRLREQLVAARQRIDELEHALGEARKP